MIPLSLRLTDFLSYPAMAEPLDLADLGLVCLAGGNGHGKTALLDALTWAVWGRARGVSAGGGGQRRLVRDGARGALVEVEFRAGEVRYRVERERGPGGTEVRFGPVEEAAWEPVRGPARDVQPHIDRVVAVDYETFACTSYLRQGDAGAFTSASPRERKVVLSRLLGLERYGVLAEEARRRRLAEQRVLDASPVPAPVDVAGAARAESAARARLAAADAERSAAGDALAVAVADVGEVRARAEAAAALTAERARREAEVQRCAGTLADARADDDGDGANLEAALRVAAAAAGEAEEVAAEIADLEARRAEARAALRVRRAELAGELARRGDAPDAREVGARLSAARRAAARLPALEAAAVAAAADAQGAGERANAAEAEARAVVARAQALEQLRAVTTAGACPVCERPWEGPAREASPGARGLSGAAAGQARSLAARARADAVQAEAAAAETAARREAATTLTAEVDTLAAQQAETEENRRRCRETAEELADLDRRLARGEPWAAEDRKLAALRAEHERLQGAAASLGRLTAALEGRRRGAARRDELTAAAASARARLEETDAALGRLGPVPDAECLSAVEAASRKARERAALGEAAAREAARAAGAAAEAHRAARSAAAAQTRAVTERGAAAVRVERWRRLEDAFGPRGIPALVMESALPEIQAEANAVLGDLTGGGYGVRLDTRAGNGSESLEVVVVDSGGGDRGVELLSGGERLRVDLSLRLALAHRSGCGLLVIDEGFGTQDTAGRHLVADALERVAGRFGLVVVVTHFDDLRDRFPCRVEVQRSGAAGSVARVVR